MRSHNPTHCIHDVNAPPPTGRDRLDNPRSAGSIVTDGKLAKVSGHDERGRNEVEMLETLAVLHLLDVLVQAVLASQLVRPVGTIDHKKLIVKIVLF